MEGKLREKENPPPRPSCPRRVPRLAVLYGTVHYFSTVYTAARSSLAYGLFAAVLSSLFDRRPRFFVVVPGILPITWNRSPNISFSFIINVPPVGKTRDTRDRQSGPLAIGDDEQDFSFAAVCEWPV